MDPTLGIAIDIDSVFNCYFSDDLLTFSGNQAPGVTRESWVVRTRDSATNLTFTIVIHQKARENLELLIICAADDFRGVPFSPDGL